MKVYLLYFSIWLFLISLAIYLFGAILVYVLLLTVLIGITLNCDLVPWRKKRIQIQYYLPQQEKEAA